MRRILVTGAAGFIGFHFAQRCLQEGLRVFGVDNLNDYYDVQLKQDRLALLTSQSPFSFHLLNLADRQAMADFFAQQRPEYVVHLAAQAGVRYSIENPHAYVDSNLVGFVNLLEGCRHHQVRHLVYASSSSVYGNNQKQPFATTDPVDHPVSLYAATKKANELMAHTYSHLYQLPTTGLRFFTVYGPWGRPDMAIYLFTRAILEEKPIRVFNFGQMERDFTYIDDIVEGIWRVVDQIPTPLQESELAPAEPEPTLATKPVWVPPDRSDSAPFRLYNLGNNRPVPLLKLIELLESALGKPALREMMPMQPGDVVSTYADIDDLTAAVGYHPSTPLEVGIPHFTRWYLEYHHAVRPTS